jgi:hypothetical protein
MSSLDRYRRAFRKKVIPGSYRGRLHVIIFGLLQAIAMGVSASYVNWRVTSVLYVALSLAYATTFTYFLHLFLLHRPVLGLRWAHRMHNWHHTFYQSHQMEYDDLDDVYMLLMPPWIQLLYFFLYLPGLTLLLSLVLPLRIRTLDRAPA